MICKNCRAQIPDGTTACVYCGAIQSNDVPLPPIDNTSKQSNNYYTPPANQPQSFGGQYYQNIQSQYNQNAQQAYNNAVPYNMQYQSPQIDQYHKMEYEQKIESAKTLGIVCIIFSFLFPIVAWILAAIGASKLNSVPVIPEFIPGIENSRKLIRIGVIIGIVNAILGAVLSAISTL